MSGRTYYTVVWDYVGGDCGDLPGVCETEEEARLYGEDWVAETRAVMRMDGIEFDEDGEGDAVYHIVRHVVGGDNKVRSFTEDNELIRTRDPVVEKRDAKKEHAARLLSHYFALLFEKNGLKWDNDNLVEMADIVDLIVEAASL